MPDIVKWIVAIALLAAGIVGFYVYADQSQLLRVVVLLAIIGVSTAIALQTSTGRLAWGFVKDARTEVRKVVWPTRKETTQTTIIVIVVVAIVAVVLWMIDGALTYLVRLLLQTGG